MNYFVKRTDYFFDGHGTDDKGQILKFVTNQRIYSFLDPKKYYIAANFSEMDEEFENDEKIKEWLEDVVVEDEENLYAQDGYNMNASLFEVREITDKDAEEIKLIIEKYDRLN